MWLILKRCLFLVAVLISFSIPAQAGSPSLTACGAVDTTTFSSTGFAMIGGCNFTTGPNGIILVVATAQVNCADDGQGQIFIGAGTMPVWGSNFFATISGTTMTVTSLVPGAGPLAIGQTLFDASKVLPDNLTIIGNSSTNPTDCTPDCTGAGGVGTYALSASVSLAVSTQMYGLTQMPGGAIAISPAMDETACAAVVASNGVFVITTISGSYVGTPNTQYWMNLAIASQHGTVTSWNNDSWTVLSY